MCLLRSRLTERARRKQVPSFLCRTFKISHGRLGPLAVAAGSAPILFSVWMSKLCILRSELLSDPDEDPLRTSDVAESVDVLIIDDLIDHGSAEIFYPSQG